MIYLQDMVTFLYLLNIEFWNEISLRWIIILVLEKKSVFEVQTLGQKTY